MDFDAYSDGKQLLNGKFSNVHVFTKYVSGFDFDHMQEDDRVTITIGNPGYWNGIIRLSPDEARSLAKALFKAQHQVGAKDQKSFKVDVE